MDPRMLTDWVQLSGAWDSLVLTFVLVAVVPVVGYLRFRRLRALAGPIPVRTKLTFYARTMASQWVFVAVLWLVLWRHDLSMADAGERLGDTGLTLGVTLALVVILAIVAVLVLRGVRRARLERLAAAVGPLRAFLPASRAEAAAFVFVCLTAGVCEELLYRGWLVNILWSATGSIWLGGAVAGVVFGVGHAYQGVKGMLRTTFIGLQLVAVYVLVGSLIPGQVLHAGADLVSAAALSLAVRRLEAERFEGAR